MGAGKVKPSKLSKKLKEGTALEVVEDGAGAAVGLASNLEILTNQKTIFRMLTNQKTVLGILTNKTTVFQTW